jgi:probable phosphoglycerate mutase
MAARFRAAFDGGSRGNPGTAAWGVALFDDNDAYLEGHAGTLGRATNNVAEYHGLLKTLDLAIEQGAEHVEIRSDSELIVRQILGRYRVRHPDLKPLYARARKMIETFASFRIGHVRREQNREADRLVNAALDRAVADGSGDPVEIFDRPAAPSS